MLPIASEKRPREKCPLRKQLHPPVPNAVLRDWAASGQREVFAFAGLHAITYNITGYSLRKQCAKAWKLWDNGLGQRKRRDGNGARIWQLSRWEGLEERDTLDLEEDERIFLQQLEPSQPQLPAPAKQKPRQGEASTLLWVPALKTPEAKPETLKLIKLELQSPSLYIFCPKAWEEPSQGVRMITCY